VNGRAEVGLPAALAGVTVLLAALSPALLPAELAVLETHDGPTVTAPTWIVSVGAVVLVGAGVLLAHRVSRVTRSRQPAAMAFGYAHALAWAGLVLLARPVVSNERTWSTPLIGLSCLTLGLLSGLLVTRHRPTAVPAPVLPSPFPGAAVTWTGQARLSADMAAPLFVFAVLVGVPSVATLLLLPLDTDLLLLGVWLLLLLVWAGQLRALWVTVTIGHNGIRIRTGPLGRAVHRDWDQIGAVEILDEELHTDSLLWARRFERRYVLRPGPALRLRQPELHKPAITVSVDHAEQGAAVAARHLADRARQD